MLIIKIIYIILVLLGIIPLILLQIEQDKFYKKFENGYMKLVKKCFNKQN